MHSPVYNEPIARFTIVPQTESSLGAFSLFGPRQAQLQRWRCQCLLPASKPLPQGSEPCTHSDLYTSDLLGECIEVRRSWQVGNHGVPDDPHPLFNPGIVLHKPFTLVGVLLTKQLQSSCGVTGTAYLKIRLDCTSFPVEAKHLE